MYKFQDKNRVEVSLSFEKNSFSTVSNDVLVFCKFNDNWLLTKHKIRGREFPGGKREKGETLEEAAHREVFEETGATIKSLQYVGEYKVNDNKDSFVKTIFYAEIDNIIKQTNYFETDGPILVSNAELKKDRFDKTYSFIMQDDVVKLVLERLN